MRELIAIGSQYPKALSLLLAEAGHDPASPAGHALVIAQSKCVSSASDIISLIDGHDAGFAPSRVQMCWLTLHAGRLQAPIDLALILSRNLATGLTLPPHLPGAARVGGGGLQDVRGGDAYLPGRDDRRAGAPGLRLPNPHFNSSSDPKGGAVSVRGHMRFRRCA